MTDIILIHEKHHDQNNAVKLFYFTHKQPVLSLSVEAGDTVLIHTMAIDYVTAGGIWQVLWHHGEWTFVEITSSWIEMVQVETLLQEEDILLYQDAAAHAIAFLEAQDGISQVWCTDGREIGNAAPERTHRVTPLPPDIRAVEHTWLIALSGRKQQSAGQAWFLTKVVYRFENQRWQFAVKILEERIAPSISMTG